MHNFPSFNKIEEILENPGIYMFKVENNEEYIQKKSQLSKDTMKYITNSIKNCFQHISDDLDKINQTSEYLSQISYKLKKFGRKFNFPGLQVVNINREKLHFFSHFPKEFLICEKSDGVRYLLIHFRNGFTILLGRNLEFFQVKLTEQFSSNNYDYLSNWNIIHFLDGELVLDDFDDNEIKGNEIILNGIKKRINFLVFDAIVINEKNIGSLPFFQRLNYLSKLFKEIKIKRKQFLFKNTFYSQYINQINTSSFITYDKLTNELIKDLNPIQFNNSQIKCRFSISLYMKDYFTLEQVEDISKNIIPILPHHNDGIIINTKDYPYYSGQSIEIYKWKPNEENTIDFEIQYNQKEDIYNLYVSGKEKLVPVGNLSFKDDSDKEKFLSGYNINNINIAECFYDNNLIDPFTNKKGGWRFSRYRNDKGKPNFIDTYENVLKCLEENISIEEIIDTVNQNKTIILNDLKLANDSISTAIWNKFYKIEKNYDSDNFDYENDDDEIDDLTSNNKININTNNMNSLKSDIHNNTNNDIKKSNNQDKNSDLIAKKRKRIEEKNKKKLMEERIKRQKKEQKIFNFNDTMEMINNSKNNSNNLQIDSNNQNNQNSFSDSFDDNELN